MTTLLLATWMGSAGAGDAREVVLGPGDMLKVSVYGSPDLATEAKVSESGHITFPLVGEIFVSGLTPSAVEKKIADLLASGGFLRVGALHYNSPHEVDHLVKVLTELA